jgi:hypothetical protein
MRELAHQELGMLSPRLQLRCAGAHVGDQRVGFDKRRRRVATHMPAHGATLCLDHRLLLSDGDFCFGSFPDIGAPLVGVRSTPGSGRRSHPVNVRFGPKADVSVFDQPMQARLVSRAMNTQRLTALLCPSPDSAAHRPAAQMLAFVVGGSGSRGDSLNSARTSRRALG